MKSVEINDLLSYHFYGNLKVKDGVKVFVDGVAAEKDNAYEYTLKCVKDDKVYDLTSFGKEAGYYIENENSVLFCGNRKNIEKSTSLYRLALNGGEAKEIARFDKSGMNVLGYLNENTLVLMTKEKLVEEENDYEVFDEIPFYMNGQGVTNKHRTHLYTYNLDTKELVCITEGTFDVSNAKIHDGALYYTGQNWTRKQALYEDLYKYDGSVSTVVDAKERSIQSFDFVDDKLVLIASTHEKYGLNENPKFFDQDFNLIADWQECVGNSVGTDCALVAGNATLVNKDALYFVSTIYDHNNLYKLENGNIELVFEWPGTIQSFAFEDDTLYFIGADTDKSFMATDTINYQNNTVSQNYVDFSKDYPYDTSLDVTYGRILDWQDWLPENEVKDSYSLTELRDLLDEYFNNLDYSLDNNSLNLRK